MNCDSFASGHCSNYKPDFLLRILDESGPAATICCLDPDITLRCTWNFIERWSRYGVCLCEEITNCNVPNDHPLCAICKEIARGQGWSEPQRESWSYYNGEFIALQARDRRSLEVWQQAIRMIAETGTRLNDFAPANCEHPFHEHPFHMTDQDALNLAVLYTDQPPSTIGPEGMGFISGEFTMYHSTGAPKPWRKQFLRPALRGIPPSGGDKHFLQMMQGPFQAYSQWQLSWKKLTCVLASMIGRFYARR